MSRIEIIVGGLSLHCWKRRKLQIGLKTDSRTENEEIEGRNDYRIFKLSEFR